MSDLGPIGSAVLTFIGYKQTDKPNLYIDEICKPFKTPSKPFKIPLKPI